MAYNPELQDSILTLIQAATTPANPVPGENSVYFDASNNLWMLNSDNVATQIGTSGQPNITATGDNNITGAIVVFARNGAEITTLNVTGVVHLNGGVVSVYPVDLTSDVSGILPTANGGTGNSSGTVVNFTGSLSGDITGTQSATVLSATSNSTLTNLSVLTSAANLNTVGTIGTGIWHGTTIGIGYGGTGQTTKTAAFNALSPLTTYGDLIYFDGTNNIRLQAGTPGQVLATGGTSAAPYWTSSAGGGGTVTSVGLTVPSWLSTSTSTANPITGSGTLAITAASGIGANYVLASPNGSAGALSPRALVAADIPQLAYSSLSGLPPLGTAAALNTGTTSGTIPLLTTGGALPAISGANLTNLPAVSSLNSLTGAVTLAAGSNVTLTPSGGNTITIAASGGGGGSYLPLSGGTLTGQVYSTTGGYSSPFASGGTGYSGNTATLTWGNDQSSGLYSYNTASSLAGGYTATYSNNSTTVTITASPYWFVITPANVTTGATYTNNGQTFTVVYTTTSASGWPVLVTLGTGAPTSSGSLVPTAGGSNVSFSSLLPTPQPYVGQQINTGLTTGIPGGTTIVNIAGNVWTISALTQAGGTNQAIYLGYPEVVMSVSGMQQMRWFNPFPNASANSYGAICTLVNSIYPDSAMFAGGSVQSTAPTFSGATLGVPPQNPVSTVGSAYSSYGVNRQYGHGFIDHIWMGSLNTTASAATTANINNQVRALTLFWDTNTGSPGNLGIGADARSSGGLREIYFNALGDSGNVSAAAAMFSVKRTADSASGVPAVTTVTPGDQQSNVYPAHDFVFRGGNQAGGGTLGGNLTLMPGTASGNTGALKLANQSQTTIMSITGTATTVNFPQGTAYGTLSLDGSNNLIFTAPGTGTSGYVWTSNGPGASPTWQPSSGGGSGITANYVLASPNGSAGALSPRALVGADIPAINLAGTGNGGVTGLLAVSSLAQSGATPNQVPQWNGSTWVPATISGSGGSVSSVAMTVPSFLSVSGSPITTSGTLAVTLSGTALPIANGGTGATTATAAFNALSPLTTQGDIIYFNGTSNVRLGPGTSGQVLTTGGAGANPSWTTVSGGGGGITTVGTFSGSSQTNGATISGSTITFGPADGTNPGMVSTGTQSFAGQKTLTGNLISNYNGTAYTPAIAVNGAPRTGGTATDSKPQVWISNSSYDGGWSPNGTYLGIDALGSFTGNLFDAQINGSSKFSISYTGAVTAGAITASSFSGPLTGNVTGNVSGTAASLTTAVNLAGTGAGGITGLLPLTNLAQGLATPGQTLTWNGTAWAPATGSSGGISGTWSSTNNLVLTNGSNAAQDSGYNLTTGPIPIGSPSTPAILSIQNAADVTSLTGMVSASGGTITGSGTSFLTQLAVGDRVAINNATSTYTTIIGISSNASATMGETALIASTGSAISTRKHAPFRVDNASGGRLFWINDLGEFYFNPAGGTVTAGAAALMVLSIPTSRSLVMGARTATGFMTGTDNVWINTSQSPGITSGKCNIVIGASDGGIYAGALLTTGSSNNFFGAAAGAKISTSNGNNLFGDSAGQAVTSGAYNSFFGDAAGGAATTGSNNTFIGARAGNSAVTGSFNTILGSAINNNSGLTSGNHNVVIGSDPVAAGLTTGSYNILMGDGHTGPATGSYNLAIGYQAVVPSGKSNYAVFGSTTGYFSDIWMGRGVQGPATTPSAGNVTFHGYDADGSTGNQSLSSFYTIFAAGRGTGSGNGSGIKWQYSLPNTTTNTTPGTLTDSLVMDPATGVVTHKAGYGSSYQRVAGITTGGAVTINASTSMLVLNGSGTVATYTVTMPALPVDGQRVTVTTNATITALTVSANTSQISQTVVNGSLSGFNGAGRWIWVSADSIWYPA